MAKEKVKIEDLAKETSKIKKELLQIKRSMKAGERVSPLQVYSLRYRISVVEEEFEQFEGKLSA